MRAARVAHLHRVLARTSYALYSSFSPGFQKYLEGLTAVHSGVAQADGARAAGQTVRREPVESVHPIVRVHPVTGYKSIYVNPGTCCPPSRCQCQCECEWRMTYLTDTDTRRCVPRQASRVASSACRRQRAMRS